MRAVTPECDEVQIRRVEHQFDANENEDGVAADERGCQTDGEQECGDEEVANRCCHFLLLCSRMAIVTAPTSAAVSRSPITSNGNTDGDINASAVCFTVTSGRDREGSCEIPLE